PQHAKGPLDHAVVVPGARPLVVLLVRDAEEHHRANAEPLELGGLGGKILDGESAERRQVGVRLRPRADEERVDEVVEVQARLTNQRAQTVAAAQTAKPGCGEAHANNLRAPRRASVPKIPPSTRSGNRRHGSPPVTPPTWMITPKATAIAIPRTRASAAARATFAQTRWPSPTSPRASRPITFSSRSAASEPAASISVRNVIVS